MGDRRLRTPLDAAVAALSATAGHAGNDAAGVVRRASALLDWWENEGWELAPVETPAGERSLRLVTASEAPPAGEQVPDLMAALILSVAQAKANRKRLRP